MYPWEIHFVDPNLLATKMYHLVVVIDNDVEEGGRLSGRESLNLESATMFPSLCKSTIWAMKSR